MSAMDPGATPAEPQAAAEPASSGPDLSGFNDRLDQLAGTVGQLVEGFSSWQQSNQPQAEPEANWWESLYGEQPQEPQQPQFDPYTGQPLQPQQQQFQQPGQQQLDPQALQNAVNQAIQQATQPLNQQLQNFQRQQALNDLTTQFPQLKDPEVAQRTQELMAQQIAHLPQQVQEALVWDPGFIGTVFKAAEAEKLAGAQEPAGGQPTQLETAGGAHPGGTGEDQNYVQQVMSIRPSIPKGLM